MTPYADHFMHDILQYAWDTVKAGGLTAWRQIFPRMLPQEFADTSWAALSARGLVVRSAFSNPIDEPEAAAVISVALVPEEQQREVLANGHVQLDVTGTTADNDRWTSLNRSTLHIYIYATPKDLVRALHVFVQSAVYSNQDWLYRAGFDEIWYLGATDLTPQPDLFPKGVDIYGRVVRMAFAGMSDIGRITGSSGIAPAWITVADVTATVTKYVDPNTGEEHDLDETVQGAMQPTTD